jgi:hypothetical protein
LTVTTIPRRVQLRRTKGWRLPEGAISCARPSRWGNTYVVGEPMWMMWSCESHGSVGHYQRPTVWAEQSRETLITPELAVEMFRHDLEGSLTPWKDEHPGDAAYREELVAALEALRGHDLACFCDLDEPCHVDVVLEFANR